MRNNWVILVVSGAFLLLVLDPVGGAINVKDIERVQSKPVLDSRDFEVIDRFVAEAVGELSKTRDFSNVGDIRTVITSHAKSNTESAREQFALQFYDSARRHVSGALEQAPKISEPNRRFMLTVNLLLLIGQLEYPRLVELAAAKLNDENAGIRYLAVRTVTNPGVVGYLNSSRAGEAGRDLGVRIVKSLEGIIENDSGEIAAMTARFAADVNTPEASKLLLQIAEARIKSAEGGRKVEDESLDGRILMCLSSRLAAGGADAALRRDAGRAFGQLLSYLIQRYVNISKRSAKAGGVLVEVEKTCISRLLGKVRSGITRAVERGDLAALLREHNSLLGGAEGPGELPLHLGYDYGRNPDGSVRNAPLELPPAPIPPPQPDRAAPE